jgi:hypothetical protein
MRHFIEGSRTFLLNLKKCNLILMSASVRVRIEKELGSGFFSAQTYGRFFYNDADKKRRLSFS